MDIIKEITNDLNVENNFRHIQYGDKVFKAYDELHNTDSSKVMKWGWKEWDEYLGGIYGGKIYLIGAESGMGKTTFMNQISSNLSLLGHRVVRYSLEDRLEDIGKEEIFYEVNRLRRMDNLTPYDWHPFNNGELKGEKGFKEILERACGILSKKDIIELEKDKKVSISELCILMEEESKKGTKAFFIDHLHYFDISSNQRRDLEIEDIMHQINEIARRYEVAIFLVAHYKKKQSKYQTEPSYDQFKDATAIYQVANVIIQIEREIGDTQSLFYTTKLRGPIPPKILECSFDLKKFEYTFEKTDELKIAQKKKYGGENPKEKFKV